MSHTERDIHFLRESFRLAEEAGKQGIHPFAAILVDADGNVLMEQLNAFLPDHDMTGHAERGLMTRANTILIKLRKKETSLKPQQLEISPSPHLTCTMGCMKPWKR